MVQWCTQLRSQPRTLTPYTYPMEFSPCSCQELLPSWANLQSEELPSKTFSCVRLLWLSLPCGSCSPALLSARILGPA